MPRIYAGAALIIALLGGQAIAAPPSYVYTQFSAPPGMYLYPRGLNDGGDIAGSYCNFSVKHPFCTGFLFTEGAIQTISPPGAFTTDVHAISNDGTIVGLYATSYGSNETFGFTYKGGIFRSFGKPGQLTSIDAVSNTGELVGRVASDHGVVLFTIKDGVKQKIPAKVTFEYTTGVNDSGTVIGTFQSVVSPPEPSHAGSFLLRNGTAMALPIPGSRQVTANAINKGGAIAGAYFDPVSKTEFGFIDQDGAITQLKYPGSGNSEAEGINNAGDVVGYAYSGLAVPVEGWLAHAGTYTVIAPPGAIYTYARAINNKGQIMGTSSQGSAIYTGFLATPQ